MGDLKRASFGFRSPIGPPIYSALVSSFLGRLGRRMPGPPPPGLGRPLEFEVNPKVNQDDLGDLKRSTNRKLRLTLRLTWAT